MRSSRRPATALSTLRQSYGGIEGTMNERFAKVESQFVQAHKVVVVLDERMWYVERNGLSSGGGGAGGGRGSGELRESSLISIKDVKLPLLNDSNPTVAAFRSWWKDLAKYCQRRETHWRGSEALFRVIRGFPNEFVAREFLDFLHVCTNRDHWATLTNFDFGGSWDVHIRSREMLTCIEKAFYCKCAEIVAGV